MFPFNLSSQRSKHSLIKHYHGRYHVLQHILMKDYFKHFNNVHVFIIDRCHIYPQNV